MEDKAPKRQLNADEILKKAMEFAKGAASAKPLLNGSDVDIAKCVAAELRALFHDKFVHYEGEFPFYNGKCWEALRESKLRLVIHKYDGVPYGQRHQPIKLGKQRINSIITELGAMLSVTDWFAKTWIGVNCLNGFIEFDGEGNPKLLPHDPEHRQRHVLPAEWHGPVVGFEGSLLERLVCGCFKGDDDAEAKIDLLGEIAGAAALGHGTRLIAPKAWVFLGREAENGKSQILELLRGLLPESAVAAIPPSKFDDEKYMIRLVGKLLNTSDELGTAKAISSDSFKSVVTGDKVIGRDLYKSAFDFRPRAQNVFACNQLPGFQGGMDRGVMRRLGVLVFNRVIPMGERIEHIGKRIVAEEMDLVLSWAVEGAGRLLRRRTFIDISSSQAALLEWAQGADSVQAWLEDRVIYGDGLTMKSSEAYTQFTWWAEAMGYKGMPSLNTFSQRIKASGRLRPKHSGAFRGFEGGRPKEFLAD